MKTIPETIILFRKIHGTLADQPRLISCLVLLVLIFCFPLESNSGVSPVEWFKRDLLKALALRHDSSSALAADSESRKNGIWLLVDGAFDGDEINPRILKRTWPVLTKEEKERLTPIMNYVIKWKLIGKLFKYDVGEVSFTEEGRENDLFILEGRLGSGLFSHPAKFIFIQKDGHWAACDMKVRGLSLIEHYRRKFDDTYFKSGLDGLIRHLTMEVNEEFEEMGYQPTGVPSFQVDGEKKNMTMDPG